MSHSDIQTLNSNAGQKRPPSGPRKVELQGVVGINSLPEQLVEKVKRKGFCFNVLCVGETGIGKSTLLDSLFNMSLHMVSGASSVQNPELQLHHNTFDVQENGVDMKLTVIESKGFGDQVDKETSSKNLTRFIDAQFEAYMQEEMRIKRRLYAYNDSRVHVCVFFISPTGHGLKTIDKDVMKQLAVKTNVIPVIAKADTVSKDELQRFKTKILQDLKAENIKYYMFPTDDSSYAETSAILNACIPFAVIGSTDFIDKGNQKVRARKYPWGVVEVENEEHCDFVKLRDALVRSNIYDLIERTNSVHYEHFRQQRLTSMGVKEGDLGTGIAAAYKERRTKHLAELQTAEKEVRDEFLKKVRSKEDDLKKQEKELQQKVEMENRRFQEEMAQLEEDEQKLEFDIAEFNRLKNAFHQQNIKRKK